MSATGPWPLSWVSGGSDEPNEPGEPGEPDESDEPDDGESVNEEAPPAETLEDGPPEASDAAQLDAQAPAQARAQGVEFSCGQGRNCFPNQGFFGSDSHTTPAYCCTKVSKVFDVENHRSAPNVYYPSIPLTMQEKGRRGGPGPLLQAIRDRVGQIYGTAAAASGDSPAPPPVAPVTGGCAASLPHVQFDIDVHHQHCPAGQSGTFPLDALEAPLSQPANGSDPAPFVAAPGCTRSKRRIAPSHRVRGVAPWRRGCASTCSQARGWPVRRWTRSTRRARLRPGLHRLDNPEKR